MTKTMKNEKNTMTVIKQHAPPPRPCHRGWVILIFGWMLALTACENEVEVVQRSIVGNVELVPPGIRIETAEDLVAIGLYDQYPADGTYYLGNDIDLSVLWKDKADYAWHPIGSTCRYCEGPLFPVLKQGSVANNPHAPPLRCENRDCALFEQSQPPFSGVLHGNGKTITGLKLTGGDGALYRGLFGYLNAAYIHDLTIKIANTENERITYPEKDDKGEDISDLAVQPHIGTLAGLARGGTIENVHVEADVLDSGVTGLYVAAPATSSYASYIGGIIGQGFVTTLKEVSFAAPLDVTGLSREYVGGIAGYSTGGIENAAVTGSGITVVSEGGVTSYLAGIAPTALFQRNCRVDITNLNLTVGTTASGSVASLSGIGSMATNGEMPSGCTVDIDFISLVSNDSNESNGSRTYTVGGITAVSTEGRQIGNHVRFGSLTVNMNSGKYSDSYIGGLVGNMGTTYEVRDCVVEAGTMNVNFLSTSDSNPAIYVGGIAGQGKIVNSHIEKDPINGPLNLHVQTSTTGATNVGGLTGSGLSESSFIGTPGGTPRPKVRVTNINKGDSGAGAVNAGGISGTAAPVATTGLFRYNYAFCDVEITIPAENSGVPSAGGLVGSLVNSAASSFFENFFQGSVTITNNGSGASNAGGIASRASSAAIAKCTVFGGSVEIQGTTNGTKNAGRIAGGSDTTNLSSNITTISGDAGSLTGKDGLYVAEVDEDTFFGTETNQLDWNAAVWEWDEASGYPRLK
jgi:hypothetical protein